MSAFVDKNGEKRINAVLISHIANQPLAPPQPAQLSCNAIAYLLDMPSYFSRVEFTITDEVRRLVLEQFAVGMPAPGTNRTSKIMESIEKKVRQQIHRGHGATPFVRARNRGSGAQPQAAAPNANPDTCASGSDDNPRRTEQVVGGGAPNGDTLSPADLYGGVGVTDGNTIERINPGSL